MLKITAITLLLASSALISTTSFAADKTISAKAMAPAKADADMQNVLDKHATFHPKPIETLTAEDARAQPTVTDAVKLILKDKGMDPNDPMGILTKDIQVDGGAGMIPARVYTPKDKKDDEKLPVIVYYHGGGWVIATNDVYDSTPRGLSKGVNAIVISVEYRKAPENKFPAAHDDAFAAYKWALANAASLGGDASKVAVVGESAGGNLAIDTAIAARDAKVQLPVYEALIYPVAGVDMNTPSYNENANAKPLNKAMMGWFVKNTITSEKDKMDPRLDIIGKANLKGLPATTIITAQIDPLRSDGEMLAEKLKAAGVDVKLKNYEGATHEFFGMALVVDDAKDANKEVVSSLKEAFKN